MVWLWGGGNGARMLDYLLHEGEGSLLGQVELPAGVLVDGGRPDGLTVLAVVVVNPVLTTTTTTIAITNGQRHGRAWMDTSATPAVGGEWRARTSAPSRHGSA